MVKELKKHKCFNGTTQFWSHQSEITKTEMKFSSFVPDAEIKGCLVWLSGLTCNEENFITKAGAQKYLAENQLMLVAPDTSPRGLDLPGEHESYDFGSGAGFYLNASTDGYRDHYKMYDYITTEFLDLVQKQFNVSRFSISGHSMGGHGALVIGLRESETFASISAFSPIVNPSETPWGQKAFEAYLGSDVSQWERYDAAKLMLAGAKHLAPVLIDQGTGDDFLNTELFPKVLADAAKKNGQEVILNMRKDYDHSYYFISTFIEEHIAHHAKYL